MDLSSKHAKHLFRPSWCVIVALIGMPIFIAFTFLFVGAVAKTESYPDFNLEKLKHPVYSMAYIDPNSPDGGAAEANFETSMQ